MLVFQFLKTSLVITIIFILFLSNVGTLYVKSISGDCREVSVIFLRGSGQNKDTRGVNTPLDYDKFGQFEQQSYSFFNELDKKINNKTKEFVSFHNQGGHKYGYRAKGIDSFGQKAEHNTTTTIRSNAYYESMYDGSDALKQYLKNKVISCPTQQIILGGYSQGAQVVGEALPLLTARERTNIKYVALYGDPKLNTKDNTSIWKKGPWVKGNTNRNINGALGARLFYLPDDMRNKAGSWCDVGDPVCAGRSLATNIINKALFDKFIDKTHSEIYQKKWISESMNEIYAKIDSSVASNKNTDILNFNYIYRKNGTKPVTDIILIVDSAGSNERGVAEMRANSQAIANSLLKDPNTKVGIVRYSNQTPGMFGSTPTLGWEAYAPTSVNWELERNIRSLHTDDPRSAWIYTPMYAGIHAANTMMERTARPGAQKQYIIFTNKTVGGPFADGVRLFVKNSYKFIPKEDIINKMYALDPVVANVVVFPDNTTNNFDAEPVLSEFASQVNGQVKQNKLDNTLGQTVNEVVDVFDTSPVVTISNIEYDGGKVYLSAGESYDPNSYITKYKWDCNNDGIWDVEDEQASVTCEYKTNYNGYVMVEVETLDGQTARQIATVTVDVTKTNINTAALKSPIVSVNYAGQNELNIVNVYEPGTYFEVYDEQEDLLLENVNSPIVHDSFLVNGSKFYVKAVNGANESALVEVKISKPVQEEPDSTPTNTVTKAGPINNETTTVFNSNTSAINVFGSILGVKLPDVVATQNAASDSFSGDDNFTVVNSNDETPFSVAGSGEGNHMEKNKPEQMSSSTKVLGENNKKEGLFSFRNLLYLAAFLGLLFITLYIIRKSNEATEEL